MPDLTSTGALAPDELPKQTKPELLRRYRSRVEGAKRQRDDEGFDKTWERLRDIYRLKMYEGLTDQDRIVVAIAFATVNVIAPSVSVNHPKIVVLATAADEDHQAKAAIAEGVVNYWWRHYKVKPEFRRAVKDFMIYGHGWLKCGWRYAEAVQERSVDAIASDAQTMSDQANQYAEQNPHLAGQLPTDDQIHASVPTHESVVVEDRPFVERVSPFDIYVDPEATSMSDARWICQRVVRPIEEVKADPRYKPSVARKLESDGSVKWQAENAPRTSKTDQARITLYEFYDLTNKTVSVFAKSGDSFLLDPAPMPYSFGIPFVMIRNYDVPDQFYPIGDIEAIEPLQNELNETRSAMVAARKLDIPKYLMRRDAMSPEAIEALRSKRAYTAVPVDSDEDFDRIIAPMPRNQASPELYQHSDVIEKDVDLITGTSEYARGSLPEIRRTATEASIIQDQANSRAADKLAIIEESIGEVAKRLIALAQEYMTGEKAARASAQNGAAVYWHFTADDIQGEFDFEVEGGSTQPHNETFRRMQATELLTAVSPFLGQVLDPAKVLIRVLRDGFGIQDAATLLAPPAQPQGPTEKLIETLAYKDAPPDIKRQMEAQAGFTPSTLGALDPQVQGATTSDANAPQDGPLTVKHSSKDEKGKSQSHEIAGLPPQFANQLAGQVGLDGSTPPQ